MSTSDLTPDQFAHKLWYTETNCHLYDWGDHGLAMGPYQEHPDWLWDWAHKLTMPPKPMESWASWEGRLVRGFYQWHMRYYAMLAPVEVAMHFHLGHIVFMGNEKWDHKYAERFELAPAEPQLA